MHITSESTGRMREKTEEEHHSAYYHTSEDCQRDWQEFAHEKEQDLCSDICRATLRTVLTHVNADKGIVYTGSPVVTVRSHTLERLVDHSK